MTRCGRLYVSPLAVAVVVAGCGAGSSHPTSTEASVPIATSRPSTESTTRNDSSPGSLFTLAGVEACLRAHHAAALAGMPDGYFPDGPPGPPELVLFDGAEKGSGSVELTFQKDEAAAKAYLAGRRAFWKSQSRAAARVGHVKNLTYEFGVEEDTPKADIWRLLTPCTGARP